MRVVWTPEANQDRLEILEFIATDNPRAAARMDQLFIDAAGQLGEFPKLGRSGKIPNNRELIPHESYRLIYEVVDLLSSNEMKIAPRSTRIAAGASGWSVASMIASIELYSNLTLPRRRLLSP